MSPNLPRLACHIGPHKTGTTYFQEKVFNGRAALPPLGWVYPELGVPDRMGGHHTIAHEPVPFLANDGARLGELKQVAVDNPGKSLLFSAEGMCHWPVNHFILLADHLEFDTIDLIYAVRDPVKLMYSHWAETVKQGFTQSYPEFLCEHYINFEQSRVSNPLVNVRDMLAHPRINMSFIPFEAMRDDKIDIVDHICNDILGIGVGPMTYESSANASFPISHTEMLRALNLAVALRFGAQQQDIRPFMKDALDAPLRRKFLELRGKLPELVTSHTVQFAVEDPIRERVELIARTAFDGRWSLPMEHHGVCSHTATQQTYYNAAELLRTPPVANIVKELMDQYEAYKEAKAN